jgi:hypothetical protein
MMMHKNKRTNKSKRGFFSGSLQSSSAIPYELYRESMHEIGSCELEEIDVVFLAC